jgi:hypothetical protein
VAICDLPAPTLTLKNKQRFLWLAVRGDFRNWLVKVVE